MELKAARPATFPPARNKLRTAAYPMKIGLDLAIMPGKDAAKDLGWRPKSRRGQPVVDLSSNIDLLGFLQKLRAANAERHSLGLQAEIDRLLRAAIFERH